MTIRAVTLALLALHLGSHFAAGQQQAKKYGSVEFPLGDLSFADEVVAFEIGEPKGPEKNSQPEAATGPPNFKNTSDDSFVALGCTGTLTLRFTDNALVDVPGPDLYVFEVGPLVEAMNLGISADGNEWIDVGEISGSRSDVDIAEHIEAGDVFHYVRLTDLKAVCRGAWPGADIDAVGAIGAAIQFSLDGSVLFETAQWDLGPAAAAELDALAAKLGAYTGGRVAIEGHTDNVGSNASNKTLSENRAKAVLDYLQANPQLGGFTFVSRGYGESRPRADNDSEEGRAKNRRVDVVLTPGAR